MSSSLHPTIEKLNTAKESATQQASTLKEISINKANELLDTQYGNMAVQGVDNTSVLVNRLLDRYFPPVEGEENKPSTFSEISRTFAPYWYHFNCDDDVITDPISADENKVLHTVQTVGQLSTKTANRVYHSVAAQLKTIKKEDVATYMSSVISILHLTQYLNLGQKQTDDKESNSPTENKDEEKK